MKAFLLAGGLGERLRPLTLTLPKCLVPIDGVPLLAIWLELCESQGVDDILVNVSQHAALVERFLNERRCRARVTLVQEAAPRGTAGTVRDQRSFVGDSEEFWVFHSDNLTNVRLGPMIAAHRAHDALLTVGLFRAPDPTAAGIVLMGPDATIERFEEKPARPSSDLANAGIYLARRALLDELPRGNGLLDFGHDVLPRLAGRMRGYVIPEFLADIGTPLALERATQAWRRLHGGAPQR